MHFLPLDKMLEDAEKAKETSLSMSPYNPKLTAVHANLPLPLNPKMQDQVRNTQ